MIDKNDLTILIVPTNQLIKHELLKKLDWIYVCNATGITEDNDIDEELSQIRSFFGTED